MAARRCPQCGATIEVDETLMSARCAFCDSAMVEDDASREPVDSVAAFDVPRDRAAGLLKGYLQGNWLAPESVRRAARADELSPVLVPFYAYDALARTTFNARIGIHWYRTETYTTFENGKTVTRTRQVQETDWHPFEGSHARRWFDHLVSASKGLVEAEANALEPFDLGRAKPFSAAMTAGMAAEHPTVPHDEARRVAGQELAELEQRTIASSHLPGDTHSGLNSNTSSTIDKVRLVLLPVWIAAFPGPSGAIRLLVNGQTGEVVGQVPRSKWKMGCIAVGVLALVASIVLALTGSMGVMAMVSR
jgi:hypothetical protein